MTDPGEKPNTNGKPKKDNDQIDPALQLGIIGKTLLGIYFIIADIICVYLLIEIWPKPTLKLTSPVTIIPEVFTVNITSEVRLDGYSGGIWHLNPALPGSRIRPNLAAQSGCNRQ